MNNFVDHVRFVGKGKAVHGSGPLRAKPVEKWDIIPSAPIAVLRRHDPPGVPRSAQERASSYKLKSANQRQALGSTREVDKSTCSFSCAAMTPLVSDAL